MAEPPKRLIPTSKETLVRVAHVIEEAAGALPAPENWWSKS